MDQHAHHSEIMALLRLGLDIVSVLDVRAQDLARVLAGKASGETTTYPSGKGIPAFEARQGR